MSSENKVLSFKPSGTSPRTMRCAKPSTIAVFADARLADQDRVVLGFAQENADHAPHFLVAADYRVELAAQSFADQVAPVAE